MSQPTPVTSQSSPHSPNSQPQRTVKACLACRNRKTRCDGERPSCLACRKRGIANACNYGWVKRRQLRQSILDDESGDAGRRTSRVPRVTAPRILNGGSTAPNVPDNDRLPAFSGINESTSYGSASMVAFHRYITSPGDRQKLPPTNARPIPAKGSRPSRNMALLPRRSSADEFVYCFFEYYQPVFPILSRPDFKRQYERLWQPSRDDDALPTNTEQDEAAFAATLNLVFAIGSRISPSLETNEKQSVPEDFYRRARDLYPYDLLTASSLPVLQMLLLMAQYSQATQYSAECWNSLGLAIRVAQSLGLHVDGFKNPSISPDELNLRRQIWHLCVQLDGLFSLTYGRPLMIGNTTVPLPDVIDDEPVPLFEALSNQSTNFRYGAFIHSRSLFPILRQIMNDMYQSEDLANKSCPSDILNNAIAFNRRLDLYTESLPAPVRYLGLQSQVLAREGYLRLQQQVLARRILFVKLCLFRPFIILSIPNPEGTGVEAALEPPTGNLAEQEMIRQYCRKCFQVTYQLSQLIHDQLGDPYSGTGWHNTHFSFCCALVLLSAFKSPFLYPIIGETEYEAAWDHCMAILEHYQTLLRSAASSRQVLPALREQLSQNSVLQERTGRNSISKPNGTDEMGGIAIPSTAGLQFASDCSVEDLFSFNLDSINDTWLDQYLPDLDLPELLPTS